MKDLRIIWKSRPILNGPLTVRKSTPASYQADMLAFHLALPTAYPDVYHTFDMGSGKGWVPVKHAGLPGVHRHAAAGGGAAPASLIGVPTSPLSRPHSWRAAGARRISRRSARRMRAVRRRCCSPRWVSEAYPSSLIAGAPRIGEYFAKLIPDLRPPVLFAGTADAGLARLLDVPARHLALAAVRDQPDGGAGDARRRGGRRCCCAFPRRANLAPNRATHFAFRRVLELFRTVPDIVYALILVWTFGVGPLAGILAIALHTVGALGKLFAEVVENADMRPWDAMRAVGGNWAQAVRFAILPQVLPNFLSYVLLRFEINVRGATVIGFVGAGGIGQELYSVISFNYYQEIGAIIVLIILTVSLIDLTSEKLRMRAIGRAGCASVTRSESNDSRACH